MKLKKSFINKRLRIFCKSSKNQVKLGKGSNFLKL